MALHSRRLILKKPGSRKSALHNTNTPIPIGRKKWMRGRLSRVLTMSALLGAIGLGSIAPAFADGEPIRVGDITIPPQPPGTKITIIQIQTPGGPTTTTTTPPTPPVTPTTPTTPRPSVPPGPGFPKKPWEQQNGGELVLGFLDKAWDFLRNKDDNPVTPPVTPPTTPEAPKP